MVFSGRSVGAFSPGTISFDWVPDPEVVAQELMVTASRLEDRSQPLALSRAVAIADTVERFTTQTDPDGNPWVGWAPSYEARARAVNLGNILERYLDLRGSATSPGAYYITTDSLFLSTEGFPEYWIYHQTGADRGVTDDSKDFVGRMRDTGFRSGGTGDRLDLRGTGVNPLPARPFIGPSFEAQLQMIEIFDQWFGGVINETFTRGGRSVAIKRGARGRFTSTQKSF